MTFLDIAHSSLDELKYSLILSTDLKYLNGSVGHKASDLAEEVGKMFNGLKTYVKREVRHD